MKIFRNTFEPDTEQLSHFKSYMKEAVFFDIETTGFSPAHTKLYLIGVCIFDDKEKLFRTTQWFSDDRGDEEAIITAFFEFIKGCKTLIHFNGNGFDIPYILQKCAALQLNYSFSGIIGLDLYRCAVSIRNVLKLANLKQKTIEKFLNVERKDLYNGGELLKVYENYLENHDDASLALLLLHNLEDIKGLPRLLTLYDYSSIFEGAFEVVSITADKKEAIVECELPNALPSRVSCSRDAYYMTAYGRMLKLKISVYTEELKYFYPNYKDYYYLPEEDRSIHKSVAFYVDKNFRTKAKAANCYSKKTGRFLPQHKEIVSPYFKIEYDDKITYFEITEDFLNNTAAIKEYVLHILKMLLK